MIVFVCDHDRSRASRFVVLSLGLLIDIHVLIILLRSSPTSIDQIAQLCASQLRRAHTKHKRDGVHEVGLARPVGADDAGEGSIAELDDLLCQPQQLQEGRC